ncbi:hypothetical protein LZ554_005418 [Drepanopeziza brunnea f. sp. 'monogermtubi']|nr:hypothetical protein LZ554_005418 [Drepanopeziza brunnea f. sp. 'monogermtubi']
MPSEIPACQVGPPANRWIWFEVGQGTNMKVFGIASEKLSRASSLFRHISPFPTEIQLSLLRCAIPSGMVIEQGTDGVFSLPGENPNDFAQIADYFERDALPNHVNTLDPIISVYDLASRLGMEEFTNKLIDSINKYCPRIFYMYHCQRIYRLRKTSPKLWWWFLARINFFLIRGQLGDDWTNDLRSFYELNPGVMKDLLNMQLVNAPHFHLSAQETTFKPCEFHDHKSRDPCHIQQQEPSSALTSRERARLGGWVKAPQLIHQGVLRW